MIFKLRVYTGNCCRISLLCRSIALNITGPCFTIVMIRVELICQESCPDLCGKVVVLAEREVIRQVKADGSRWACCKCTFDKLSGSCRAASSGQPHDTHSFLRRVLRIPGLVVCRSLRHKTRMIEKRSSVHG